MNINTRKEKSVYYKLGDSRIIRVEPNPEKKMKNKFVMKTYRMSKGSVVRDSSGRAVRQEEELKNVYRVPGTSQTICQGLTKSNTINTGLDILIPNPFKNESVYKNEWGERLFKDKDKAKLQHVLEYELGYEHNYLNNKNIGVFPSDKNDLSFFQKPESKPKLDGHVTLLNMSNEIHRIWYYSLLAMKKVASSLSEIEDNPTRYEWVITDEKEKQDIKASKIERSTTASFYLETLKRSKSDAIFQMAKALEIDAAFDRNMNTTRAFNLIHDHYNKNSQYYDSFIENYELWEDPQTREIFIAKSELFDLIKLDIVSYRNGKYTYIKRASEGNPSETFQRNSKLDFIKTFMLDPAYSEEVDMMNEEYRQKMDK